MFCMLHAVLSAILLQVVGLSLSIVSVIRKNFMHVAISSLYC